MGNENWEKWKEKEHDRGQTSACCLCVLSTAKLS